MPKAVPVRSLVKNGRLSERANATIKGLLALYEDSEVEITVGKPRRSNKANAYLWGVCYPLIQRGWAEAGKAYPAEALHAFYADKYLPPDFAVEIAGEHIYGRARTSRLDSFAFYEFVEAIRTDETVLALGVLIPDPDPDYKGTVTIQNRLAA